MSGYLSRQYAWSLAEFGDPRQLPSSKGWILEREIPDRPGRDAMGIYPLFVCDDWSGLADDLHGLSRELVSLVLVADPIAEIEPESLDRCFNRGVRPFKRHHVVELDRPVRELASPHHRRNSVRALRDVEVEHLEDPSLFLEEWISMYNVLIRRHEIQGIGTFSPSSFAKQFDAPGLVAFRAEFAGETVGMLIWYVEGETAYYHLGAYSTLGYQRNASFALFWRAIEFFTGKVRRLNLGAGAGCDDGSGGLDRFKAGWATGTKIAYLCRHVFQPERYEQLCSTLGDPESPYFPAYRSGERERSPSLRG